nr:hypothetical protein [uncultured Fusobacterium sp.]
MDKEINLYLEFLASEYEYSEETIEEIKEEILNNFNEEHGLLYLTSRNDTREFQLNINFKEKTLKWYVDDELIHKILFTEKEFLDYLEDLDYQYLYSYFADYEDD